MNLSFFLFLAADSPRIVHTYVCMCAQYAASPHAHTHTCIYRFFFSCSPSRTGAHHRVGRAIQKANVSICQHTSQHTSAYVSIRQHTSAYVSLRNSRTPWSWAGHSECQRS
jgi:hypothetical protein